MSKVKLEGIYAPHIEQFVRYKRALGYKYNNEEYLLSLFDQFTVESSETTVGISKELSDEWCAMKDNESYRYREMRCVIFKLFSEYLNSIGIKSYIPNIRVLKSKDTYVPYVFTKDEISAIFNATDSLCNSSCRKDSVIFSLPCLFRVLYGTGLRIGEAIALKNKDVNLIDNFIKVGDSKNGLERIIPISDTIVSICKEYVSYKEQLPIRRTNNTEDAFFVSLNGNQLIYMSVGTYFREVLAGAKIEYIGRQHGPRIHDLRHTFACHALKSMVENGLDLYYSLPVLSTYLGHRTLESTEQYVRITSEIYPHLLKDIDSVCLDVFPKTDYL